MAKPKVKPVKRFVPHQVKKLPLPEQPTEGNFTRFMREHPEAFDHPRQWPQEASGLQINPDPSPPQGQIVIVEPDPLHGKLGLVYMVAAQRILAFAQQYPMEVNPETFVRMVLARVVAKDPTVKLLVALDANTGEIRGHILAMIEGTTQDRWVFCYQAQAEPGVLGQMIDVATPWGKEHGATWLLMATQMDPDFWKRQYHFETVRHVMRRVI